MVEIIFEVTANDNLVNKLHLQKGDEGDGLGQKLTILKPTITTLLWIRTFSRNTSFLSANVFFI